MVKELRTCSPKALAAYKRRWGNEYAADFDDSGWWKWLIGWDAGYQAGLRAALRLAEGKSGE